MRRMRTPRTVVRKAPPVAIAVTSTPAPAAVVQPPPSISTSAALQHAAKKFRSMPPPKSSPTNGTGDVALSFQGRLFLLFFVGSNLGDGLPYIKAV